MTAMTPTGNLWNPAPPHTDGPTPRLFVVVAVVLAIGWIALTGWFVTTVSNVGSPDEAANQYFMRHLAATGQYRADSGLPADVNQVLYPRSVARQSQFLAPGSFLGLVQLGALTIKVFGVGAERFLIPLLGLGGLFCLYLLLRRFWNRWWALATTVLVAVHPAWFGQISDPYLHNGGFIAFLIMGAWGMMRLLERPTIWRAIVAGALFGGALYFRPVEALWTVPAVMILLLARKLWWMLLIVGAMTVVVQVPWLLANHQIYGSTLSSAYTPSGIFTEETPVTAAVTSTKVLFTPPGGVWTWHWLSSVWWYLIVLASPVSVLGLLALGRYLRRAAHGIKMLKLGLLALPLIFLLVYYGTWNLYPTSTASEIGWFASYVRYWLPIYIFLCVGASVALRKMFGQALHYPLMVLLIVTCLVATLFHTNSGVRQRLAADQTGRARQVFILKQTESSSLVIAGQQDKYLFGRRRVAFAFPTTSAGLQAVQSVVKTRPVYLYGTLNQFSPRRLDEQLAPYGLRLGSVKKYGSENRWPSIPL